MNINTKIIAWGLVLVFLCAFICLSRKNKDHIKKETNNIKTHTCYDHQIEDDTLRQPISKLQQKLLQSNLLSNQEKSLINVELSVLYYYQNNFLLSQTHINRGLSYLTKNENLDDVEYLISLTDIVMLKTNIHYIINEYDSCEYYLDFLLKQVINWRDVERLKSIIADIYFWKAILSLEIGNLNIAEAYCFNSIRLISEVPGDSCNMADVLSLLCEILTYKEEFKKAEVYQNKAMTIAENCHSDSSIVYADVLTTLGILYYESREYQKSLDCFSISLQIFKSHIDTNNPQIGIIYSNLGDAFCKSNQYDLGISYYKKAEDLFRQYGLNNHLMIVLHNLGNSYKDQGKHDLALKYYHESLDINKKTRNHKSLFASYTYQHLGGLYLKSGHYFDALTYYKKAVDEVCFVNIDSLIFIRDSIMNCVSSDVELLESLYYCGLNEYLLHNETGDLSYLLQASESFQKSIALLDIIRNQFLSEESKLLINSIRSKLFRYNILCLFKIHPAKEIVENDNKLLQAIEERRYSTLKSLVNLDECIKNSNLPKKLIYKFDSLQHSILGIISQLSSAEENRNPDLQYIKALRDNYFANLFAYDSLILFIENKYPEYNQKIFSGPQHFEIQNIQDMLNDSTALLSYNITDSLLIISAINNNQYIFYDTLIEGELGEIKKSFIRSIRFSNIDTFKITSSSLYDILISPVLGILEGCNHLIIVPDIEYADLPYEALLVNKPEGNLQNEPELKYLIQDYAISYKYSIGLGGFECFHDNTFSYSTYFSGCAPFAQDYLDSSSLSQYPRTLRYSGDEVREIAKLFSESGMESRVYLNENANLRQINSSLESSKIFHLATHSITHLKDIGSYFYCSSENTDKTYMQAYNDQLNFNIFQKVYLSDIYGINVRSELVTISTCSSGVGEKISGEGLMSLARGFFYAGAQNVLFSLWDISDKQTKDFMLIFYTFIEEGISYPIALQKTKKYFIGSSCQLPLFWSGFILNH